MYVFTFPFDSFLCLLNSGIEGDLVACIAMSPLIREKLAPALIHTYCSVDIVEGLDVDKEEFDKFSARFEHRISKFGEQ